MPRTTTSDETPDEEIVLGILGVVERDPSITQRRVASELGIALGLVNSYVKRCVSKGYLKVSQAPARRYVYYLTPTGFAEKSRLTASFLAHSFSFFRQARAQCDQLLAEIAAGGARNIVLFGDGDLAEIVRLVSGNYGLKVLQTVDGTSLVEELVRDAGTADHYVVTSLDRPHEFYRAATRLLDRAKVSGLPLLRLPIGDTSRSAHHE